MPLRWALEEGHLEIAQVLFELGENENAQDGSDQTPWDWASREGHG